MAVEVVLLYPDSRGRIMPLLLCTPGGSPPAAAAAADIAEDEELRGAFPEGGREGTAGRVYRPSVLLVLLEGTLEMLGAWEPLGGSWDCAARPAGARGGGRLRLPLLE